MTTTDLSVPMELLGMQPGISVIDPSTVLTRLWYFDGKFLRAEGFRRDQEYFRALVALSNQAVGSGVVHGFDVRHGRGDALHVSGGLALAPSGRVVHLPRDVDLAIATLIARSAGELEPRTAITRSKADFAPCPPETPSDPVHTVPVRPLYVLTVAAAEALCGEEERFGQLCEDACATETDRSLVVEGARFRVRELHLTLPVSARVPFDATHLRSRVATAYFELERHVVPSMISGPGLRTDVWCRGADGVGGDEVPLAVFERSGAVTTWIDMWTVRRELIETTPHRYWEWRLAMRPLDVFLAQVLQFQCQLIGATGEPGGPGLVDPCAHERSVLVETQQVLEALVAKRQGSTEELGSHEHALLLAAGGAGDDDVTELTDRLEELRTRISGALTGPIRAASGSLLLDWGHVTLPSGGYLPVDPTRPLEPQVRALMGPGVDLRFCAVRADFIPEALQEAQHMERISLTQGIDDPSKLEEVDVLVPAGVVSVARDAVDAFEGRVRVLPAVLPANRAALVEQGSVLMLAAVARDQTDDGWSWTMAAHGEAPQRLAVADVVAAFAGRSAGDAAAAGDADSIRLYVEHDATHDATIAESGFGQRLNREGVMARERLNRIGLRLDPTEAAFEVPPDRPIARDEKRPFSLWIDVETDRDLRDVPIGGQVSIRRLRGTAYSRASTEPLFVDLKVTGSLVVAAKHTRTATDGDTLVDIVTNVEGFVDPLMIAGGQVYDLPPRPMRGLALRWRVGVTASSIRILDVAVVRGSGLRAAFEDAGTPRKIHGTLATTAPGNDDALAGNWIHTTAMTAGTEEIILADLDLSEAPGALDLGAPGRELGEAVIDVIGTALAAEGREAGFAVAARQRLFGLAAGDVSTISPTTDWVMFHRRRTKTCADSIERPRAVRRLQWFHALIDDVGSLSEYGALAGRWQRATRAGDIDAVKLRDRLDHLGFVPVAIVEFPEQSTELASSRVALRAAWSASPRGSMIVAGIAASPPTGDGPSVDLGRLMTATSVVADLIDTSRMQTDVITEIPPEFQSSGIDGALFTIGYGRRDAETTNVLLVRVASVREAMDRLAGTASTTRDALDQIDMFEVGPEAIWTGTEISNQGDLIHWLGQPGSTGLYLGPVAGVAGATPSPPAPIAALRDALSLHEVGSFTTTWSDPTSEFALILGKGPL